MIRISPTTVEPSRTLPIPRVGELIASIGTDSFAATCLDVLDERFAVDHWALFRYPSESAVQCIASASRIRVAAAQSNVQQFIERCHRVDPSLIALREREPETACIAEMQAGDIRDRQYRNCFEMARVKERISFFVRLGTDLHQLSIYRSAGHAAFSAAATESFASLASVIVTSGTKHERLACLDPRRHRHLDVEAIEHLLRLAALGLSRREREVCARAAIGSTIIDTAAELRIGSTSVVTYRQRAYQKLHISRQGELMALISRLRPLAA